MLEQKKYMCIYVYSHPCYQASQVTIWVFNVDVVSEQRVYVSKYLVCGGGRGGRRGLRWEQSVFCLRKRRSVSHLAHKYLRHLVKEPRKQVKLESSPKPAEGLHSSPAQSKRPSLLLAQLLQVEPQPPTIEKPYLILTFRDINGYSSPNVDGLVMEDNGINVLDDPRVFLEVDDSIINSTVIFAQCALPPNYLRPRSTSCPAVGGEILDCWIQRLETKQWSRLNIEEMCSFTYAPIPGLHTQF